MKVILKKNKLVEIDGVEVGKWTSPYWKGDYWSFKPNSNYPEKGYMPQFYQLTRYRLVDAISWWFKSIQ